MIGADPGKYGRGIMAFFCNEYAQLARGLLADQLTDLAELRALAHMRHRELAISAEKIWPGIGFLWRSTLREHLLLTIVRFQQRRDIQPTKEVQSEKEGSAEGSLLFEKEARRPSLSLSEVTTECGSEARFDFVDSADSVDPVDSANSADSVVPVDSKKKSITKMSDEAPPPSQDPRLRALLQADPGTPGPSTGRAPSPFEGYREPEHQHSQSESSMPREPRLEAPQVPPPPTIEAPQAIHPAYSPTIGLDYRPTRYEPGTERGTEQPMLPPTAQRPQVVPWAPSALYQAPMPDPGTPGAPFFDGKDATEALENFEKLCKRRGIVDSASLCELFPDYCEKNIRWWAKANQAYLALNWEQFKYEICEDFKEQDSEHQRFSRSSLMDLVHQPHKTDVELRQYISQFTTIAYVLLKKGMILEWQCCEWLLSGLPSWLREKVIRKERISFEEPSAIGPIRLSWVTKAINEALTNQRLYDKAMKAVTQAAYQQQVQAYPQEHLRDAPAPPQEYPRGVKGVHWQEGFSAEKPPANHISGNQQGSQSALRPAAFDIEKAFEKMDQKFNSMSLEVNSLKALTSQQGAPSAAGRPAPRPYASNPPQSQPYPQAYPQVNRDCYYCGGEGHFANPQACRDLKEDLASGKVHYNGPTLHIGPQGEEGPRLARHGGRPFKEFLPIQLANWRGRSQAQVSQLQPFTEESNQHQAPGSMVQLNYLATRLGVTPELNEEIDDDDEISRIDEINAGVYALNTRASQDAARKRRRENGVATTRSYEAGRFEPLSQQARVEEVLDEEVMMDSPPTVRESEAVSTQDKGKAPAARRQAPRTQLISLDTELEEDIKGRFLSTKVEISLEEMAKLSSRFRRTLFTEPKEPQEPPTAEAHSLEMVSHRGITGPGMPAYRMKSQVFQDERRSEPVAAGLGPPRDVYSLGLLQTDVVVKEHALEAMLDTGSALDVIGLDLASRLGLPIKKDPQLHVVPVNGVKVRCLGCIQNMPVAIGDIVIYINAFVIRHCGLILGRPFMEASMMQLMQKPDGRVECMVYNPERSRRVHFSVYKPDEKKTLRAAVLWPDDAFRQLETDDFVDQMPLN